MDIKVQRFYRFHPKTGQDANELDTGHLTPEQKQELAAMVAAGAKFYWEKSDDHGIGVLKGYTRVERQNVSFALKVAGVQFEFVDTAPAQPVGEDS